jgi:hypothetical protein
VSFFKIGEFAKELIVGFVGDGGLGQDVIAVVVIANLFTKMLNPP